MNQDGTMGLIQYAARLDWEKALRESKRLFWDTHLTDFNTGKILHLSTVLSVDGSG